MRGSSLSPATLGALAVALAALALDTTPRAPHAEQLIAASAAGGAWLGFLCRPSRSDMLIPRLLLAMNLAVYGIDAGASRPPSVAALLLAALIAGGAVRSHNRRALHIE